MRRFFWILVLLIVSVWIGLRISQDPGYALFTYRNWSVEMPLWFAAVALILIVFLLHTLLRLSDSFDFSVYRWKNWLRWRRKSKAYSKTNRGLIELIEGRWPTAEQYLLDGVPQADAPLINYLAAAKAAHEQGAFVRRDTYLRKAHDLAPQAEVAIGLTQAELQFQQGQLEQSLATLGHLRNMAPKNGLVLKLLERVYVHLADWTALLKLMPFLRKAKIINPQYLEKLEQRTYQELLQSAAHKPEGLSLVQQVWDSIPKKIQKEPEVILCYAKLLMQHPEMNMKVEELLSKALKKSWDKELVRLYGVLVAADSKKQLARAEGWQKQYGNQAVLLLTLGRLCMRCQLWGKARNYFEESLKLEESPETYAEYGKLLERLGEADSSMQPYKDGLLMMIGRE